MKYHVENIRNTKRSIAIGPLQTEEQWNNVIDIMYVLQAKTNYRTIPSWRNRFREGNYVSFNFLCGNKPDLGYGTCGESYRRYGKIISYERFMEHNTKKIYRIKTWEELLSIPHTKHEDRSIVYEDVFFREEMKNNCGVVISEEEYEKIVKDNGAMVKSFKDGWVYHSWMVTEEIVPIKLEDMKKAVAYKLKKEYPGKEIGEIVKLNLQTNDGSYFWINSTEPVHKDFQPDLLPEWFEPIYKEHKPFTIVTVGNPSKTLQISFNGNIYNVGVDDDLDFICRMDDLNNLLALFKRAGTAYISKNIDYHSLWIGCKNGTAITKEDIEKIIIAYKEEYES